MTSLAHHVEGARAFVPLEAHLSTLPQFARGDATAPRASQAVEARKAWETRYRRRLVTTDAVIVALLSVIASAPSSSLIDPALLAADPWLVPSVPLAIAAGWLIALSAFNTRAPGIVGSGATEYHRVAHATCMAFGMLAVAFIAFQWSGIRTQLLVAFPVGIVALLAGRWMWRRWLVAQRARGRFSSRTVVVGNRDDVEFLIRTISGDGRRGYTVVGTAIEGQDAGSITVAGVSYPVVRDAAAAVQAAASVAADTIILATQPDDDPAYIRRLAWELEGTAAELIIPSRITDVAGPRMSLRQVEGLPLIHVQIPRFEGGAYIAKRALDVLASGLALTLFAPFAAIIAIAIKLDSPGPVLFKQTRIGRDGEAFEMTKFRSMRTTAESELESLLAENEGAGPLFKLRNDPRVTRVGRLLRKTSLDEVPQFWNVLRGDMSVVGPRPPLPSEVMAYDGTVLRRLYIKPGITGPWQVGGRSDLSWEESVRLDLRYVENWSVLDDIIIMWRTAKAMVTPDGAY